MGGPFLHYHTHPSGYLNALAAKHGFEFRRSEHAVLRLQNGVPAEGLAAVSGT
jgi:hypothetical protein